MEYGGRRSIRLKGYDYSAAGGYYVTIVARGRECLFGEITGREMRANTLGQIAEECWQAIPEHFSNSDVDVFVVMPNHVHGIIMIHDAVRGTIYRAPNPTIEQFGKPTAGSLPTIVRTYKAAVARRARRELGSANIWQRNYYEHIIRNLQDYGRIAGYIADNPANWEEDEQYLRRIPPP
jgi:putative transposase